MFCNFISKQSKTNHVKYFKLECKILNYCNIYKKKILNARVIYIHKDEANRRNKKLNYEDVSRNSFYKDEANRRNKKLNYEDVSRNSSNKH